MSFHGSAIRRLLTDDEPKDPDGWTYLARRQQCLSSYNISRSLNRKKRLFNCFPLSDLGANFSNKVITVKCVYGLPTNLICGSAVPYYTGLHKIGYLTLLRPKKIINNNNNNIGNQNEESMGHLNKIGTNRNTEALNGYCEMTDVTVRRRSFCLHTFSIFPDDKMSLIQSKCMYF